MTGKNSITGNPDYKIPGRILVGTPFKSIINQSAYDAGHSNKDYKDRQYFAHSTIEKVVENFKKSHTERVKISIFTTLKGVDLPKNDDYPFLTTYDQILNVSHEDMSLLDYIVVDECHSFSSAMNYRAEKIARLVNYLIEFVAKKPTAKTKIIFMTGTPDVEALVIPELMKEQNIAHLYQPIKVDKTYNVGPTINLLHLDLNKKKEREEVILKQTLSYINQNRKVVHIFNCKEKMDSYHREIQAKLTNTIKIGLFYSGSEGTCTENILAGKFDDYDVVLATTFYINGININLDKLSSEEVSNQQTSTQKYGVIIDLQNLHKKVNALEAVQVVNRFRNRLCDCTVLFPSFFRPDEKNPKKSFNYQFAERVLLGINTYNRQLLSPSLNKTINTIEEDVQEEKIFLLDTIRKTPEKLTTCMIEERMQKSKDEFAVINSFKKKSNIYQDWFYSLDGFNYMAKNAGFNVIIDNANVIGSLKMMTEDQIELENRVIRNFLDDEKGLQFLKNHLDIDKRFKVEASGVIKDPLSDKVSKFEAVAYRNDVTHISGDFHPSHERTLNKVIKHHLKLSYLYGMEKAIQIFRFLINEEANFLPFRDKRYLKSITNYVKPFYFIGNEKYLKGINYLRTLDYLSQKNIGIIKIVKDTHYSFTIVNPELTDKLKLIWAQQQFDKIGYGIDNCKGMQFEEKKRLKEKFSNQELIRETDLEDLEEQLNRLVLYTPMKNYSNGRVKSYERIVIPRLLRSDNFLKNNNFLEEETISPEYSDSIDSNTEFESFNTKLLKRLNDYFDTSLWEKDLQLEVIFNFLQENLEKKEIQKSIEHIDVTLDNSSSGFTTEILEKLNLLKKEFSSYDNLLLSSFKMSEYLSYKEIHQYKTMSFLEKLFFCDEDFMLERLDKKFDADLKNYNMTDIYDSLTIHAGLFTKSKRLRVRTEKGRETINLSSSKPSLATKQAFVIFNSQNEIIYADFKKEESLKYLCNYAYSNQSFIMKDDSIPVKIMNKGIYNPETFRVDYYDNSSKNKTVANYKIKIYDINLKEFVNYVQKKKK